MTSLRSAKVALSIVFALTLIAPAARAATITSATTTGPWMSPGTWVGGVVPVAADDVVIAAGHTVTIAPGDVITVQSIAINGGDMAMHAVLQANGTVTVTTTIALAGKTPFTTGSGGNATLEIGGSMTAVGLTATGGSAMPLGPGGAATVTLATSTATLTLSSSLTTTTGTVSGTFLGGVGSVNLGTMGTLDVRGAISNGGQISLGGGTLKSGGAYSGAGTFTPGTGTVILNGTTSQSWDGVSALHNLVVANTRPNAFLLFPPVSFSLTVTLTGALTLQDGILDAFINTPSVTRTNGHVWGFLNLPIAANQVLTFPVGTIDTFAPVTVKAPAGGSVSVGAFDFRLNYAGASSLDVYWEIGASPGITSFDQLTLGYAQSLVGGTEAAYVLGRSDVVTNVWSQFPATIDTVQHRATSTGPVPASSGFWTAGEPWAVTTATNYVGRIATTGGNPKVNTPFGIFVEGRDGSGNRAVFPLDIYGTVALAVGGGILTDYSGSTSLSFYAATGESSAGINDAIYNQAGPVTLTISEASTPAVFPPISIPVTFDPAASSLVVTTTASSGPGSLLDAIKAANIGGCSVVAPAPCPITFNIPDALKSGGIWRIIMPAFIPIAAAHFGGVASLSAGDQMVPVTSPVTIDATSQPGYTTAGGPVVELNTSGSSSGLKFHAGSSTVRGLAIVHGALNGVVITGGAVGVAVSGNSYRGGGLPIDLNDDSAALANDAGDGDTNVVPCASSPCVSGNNGQNTPEISSANLVGTTLETTLGVDSSSVTATKSIRVEVYARDGSGTAQMISNGCFAGNVIPAGTKITTSAAPVMAGSQVLASATSYTVTGCQPTNGQGLSAIGDGTSEFSAPVAVAVVACNTPAVTITGPTSACTGASVTLDAGAAFTTYLWSNGATTQTISVALTSTTSYSVTVTNSNGCSATSAQHTISVVAAPTAAITGPASVCSGGSVTLDAGAGFAAYLWSNGATTQTISVAPTATASYTVKVTSAGGCNATSAPHTVSVLPLPTASISGPTSVCGSTPVTLDAGPGFSSYLWTNGATTQTITVTPTATTAYQVTVAGSNGCKATSPTHTVTFASTPTLSITGPASVCIGGSVTLDAGAGFTAYLWSNGATTRTITVTQTQATTYSVEVTATGGCKASASKQVGVSPGPNAVISAPSSVDANSSRHSASVASQQGASYVWSIVNGSVSSGQGTNAITFAAGGSGNVTISVTVTIGGCSDSRMASVTIIDPTADLSISMSAPAEVRGGDAFAYTIEVRNDGPAGATDVLLTTTLPSNVAVTGVTSSWPCTTGLESVTCRAGSAPIGAAGTISIAVRAPFAAGPITATAAISSGSTDTNPSNNSASASTVVLAGQISCPTVPPALVSPADNATGATSPVTFSWNAVEGATAYELWISSNGAQLLGTTTSTTLSAQVPSGTISWYVVARTPNDCASLTSASRRLTVAAANNCPTTAPQITSPAAGSTATSPVTVTWTSVPNASGYRVLARAAGDATAQDLGTTTTALTLTAAVAPGSVELFVEAIFSGCQPARSAGVTFNVATPDPCADRTIVALTAPAQNATINSSLVRLEWSAANRADAYRVWVSVDSAVAQTIGSTEGETFFQAALARGTVVWWIEALYDGCASTESERRSFTIPPAQSCGTALADPILPVNNAVLPNRDVTFTWANVPSAVEYELWVTFGEGSPTLFGETDGNTTNLTAPVPAGNMRWFVRARVDRCPPRDSASAAFTHQPPAVCTANQRPLLVFPADGEEITSPMNLRWSTPPGANRFEILVDRGNGPSVAASTTAGSADNVSLPTGRVKWFARAFYGNGCPALDSAEQRILVLPQPATCSELAAPVISAPGQMSSGVAFRIHWTPIPGATGYHLLMSSRPDFGGAEQISVTAADYQLTRENRSGGNAAVYARVRAVDSRCSTAAFGPYGPTAAIFILPFGSSEAGTLASEGGIVESTITLPAELAGQSFTATPNATWLTVTPSSGVVAPGGTTLTVTADTRGLALGTNLGGITITTVTASSGPMASQGTTTVTSPITVNLVTPMTQTPKSGPPPDALIVPAVAHADGVNAKFQSDVRVTNSSAQLMKYLLTFTPTGEGIAAGRQTTMSIEPGRTVALDDVLKTWFGSGTTSSTVGTLEVRPMTQAFAATSSSAVKGLVNLATFASSRTFNMTANGSFGQYIPAIPFANFVGKSATNAPATVLSLQQISQSDRFRTNLGLVEGSGNPASLLVSVFSNAGTKLTSFVVDLKGGQHTQLNSFLKERGITSLDDGRVEVAVLSGIGKVTAYASVLDNATSDPLLVTPVSLADAGDTKWVLPGVADLNNGFANWQTDLRIFNGGTEEVETTVTLHSQNGGEPRTTTVKVPAGQVRQFDRALSSLFSISNDGGALHITTPAAARLIATARTYNQTSTGTYGQFISAVTASETAAVGTRPLQLLQIEESDRFRSNIGLAEVSGKPVKVSISVIPADSKVTAFLTVELAANEFRQIGSLLRTVGMTNTHNARVTVRAIEGSGRVAAYASVIDLQTQDPTYIPAQ